jgi:hypothetical protein
MVADKRNADYCSLGNSRAESVDSASEFKNTGHSSSKMKTKGSKNQISPSSKLASKYIMPK